MGILNLLLSLISLVGACLVARAYLPHIPLFRSQAPSTWLARAFVLSAGAYFPRTAYWDVGWHLVNGQIETPVVNAVINAAIITAEYCALRARYEAIPEEERNSYTVLTVYRHPPGHRLFRLR